MKILSYFHGIDPSAAIVIDGEVRAYLEEERLLRYKHAENVFPIRSIAACLDLAGTDMRDLDAIVYGWDAPRYASGDMSRFYAKVNSQHPPDEGTLSWQQRCLGLFAPERLTRTLRRELVRWFDVPADQIPSLEFYAHHRAHAAAAFYLSPFDDALVLVLDGSGDSDCTTIWHGSGASLQVLHRIEIPNSLGWFYAAITEFLGFRAYDGEYKVMGLAAYGRENKDIRRKLEEIVRPGPLGFDCIVDPTYIHHGSHTYSDRFTDALVQLVGVPPRQGGRTIESIHHDIAYEAQRLLEKTAIRLVRHFQRETGLRKLCIGGGVGLNVKLNSRLNDIGIFDEIAAFPVPNDSGLAIGAAVGLWVDKCRSRPSPLRHLYLGCGFTDSEIEQQLRQCGLSYECPADLAEATADLLAAGKVVGWFQGRMEGGPRALGGRSILADPRTIEARDHVNAAIKFREYWRPFCPSLAEESAHRYLERSHPAPFMIVAFHATEYAHRSIPAVVHVDGTVRVQTVNERANPRYHALLRAFERKTGQAALLNTSFNVNGEAIVCTPRDAIRTFFATGIDALAIGAFLIVKPSEPAPVRPEDAVR